MSTAPAPTSPMLTAPSAIVRAMVATMLRIRRVHTARPSFVRVVSNLLPFVTRAASCVAPPCILANLFIHLKLLVDRVRALNHTRALVVLARVIVCIDHRRFLSEALALRALILRQHIGLSSARYNSQVTSLHFWSICSWLRLRLFCRCLSQYLFLQAKCRIVTYSLC